MTINNYPPGTRPADFDDRGSFQGDVSRREVEITISVDAEMVNGGVAYGYIKDDEIRKAIAAALIASWHEENDKDDDDDDGDDHPDDCHPGDGHYFGD